MHSIAGLGCLLLFATSAWSQTAQKKLDSKKKIETKAPVESKKPIDPTRAQVDKNRKKWQFSLGLGYSSLAKMSFEDVRVAFPEFPDQEPISGSFDFTWKDTSLLNMEIRFFPFEIPFGIGLGASADLERAVDSITGNFGTLGSSAIGAEVGGQKIMQFILYSNAIYRWKAFYAQIGGNYSLISYTLADIEAGLQVKGGPGFQGGLGFVIRERFAAELNYRRTSFSVRVAEDDVILNFGEGQFSTFIFGLRYFFN